MTVEPGPCGPSARQQAWWTPAALTVAAGAAACALVWFADPTTPGGAIPVCPTKAIFGIVCPGCGSSRMLYSLLHGDFLAAVQFNAVGLVALAYFAWWTARSALDRRRRTRTRTLLDHRWAPWGLTAIFLVWLVVRNLPFAPFTALRV